MFIYKIKGCDDERKSNLIIKNIFFSGLINKKNSDFILVTKVDLT